MKIFSFLFALVSSLGILRAEEPAYPLETCVVSGEKLGSMGKPYVFSHQGTEVRLCCDHCKPKFEQKPEEYLQQLRTKEHAE